jgi:hypothetical protein
MFRLLGLSAGGTYTSYFPGAIITTMDPLFWRFSSLSMYAVQTLFSLITIFFFYMFIIMLKLILNIISKVLNNPCYIKCCLIKMYVILKCLFFWL